MLNNLNWINPGERFPPDSERERLKMYADNKALFESEHAEIYKKDLERIERVINDFQERISYPVVLNFQKLMALKIADFLFGERPVFSAGDDGSREQETIDIIIKNNIKGDNLVQLAYQAAIDVVRFGDGLFEIYNDGEKGVISTTQPQIWFPVVDEDDIKTVTHHVLAWVTQNGRLKIKIHNKGNYEIREYQTDRGMITKEMGERQIIQTGLDDFAIVQISNTKSSDRITGLDDFTPIDSIISNLIVRIGQVDRILDKHASPTVSGPQSALERDPIDGMWRMKMGDFFIRDTLNDPPVEYIVWEGQLAANFQQIDKLVNMLYSLSEMGAALFGDMSNITGSVPSGTALKRLMISPLSKVNRIRMQFDPALKKAIRLCSMIGGENIINLKDAEISINWYDGLPQDPTEDAAIISSRTGGKSTMSQYRAMMIYDGMSEEKANEELQRIQDEESEAEPMKAPPFSQANKSTEVSLKE